MFLILEMVGFCSEKVNKTVNVSAYRAFFKKINKQIIMENGILVLLLHKHSHWLVDETV